jgi:hypothetical protein
MNSPLTAVSSAHRGCGRPFLSGVVANRGESKCRAEVCSSCEVDTMTWGCDSAAIECVLCTQTFHHSERKHAETTMSLFDAEVVIVCALCRDLAQKELWKCKFCCNFNSGLTVRVL